MASNQSKPENTSKIKIVMIGFAVMLVLATLTSAYSVWQASSYSNSGSTDLLTSNGLRTESSKYLNYGLQEKQVDIESWLSWVSAVSQNNTALANFIEARFRDEFKPAFYAWLNSTNSTDGVPAGTPFSLPEYKNANIEKSQSIDQQITQYMNSAAIKGSYASRLTLMTVIMASIIVICGFESRMRSETMKLPLLFAVVIIYFFALYFILQVPPLMAF